MLTYDCASELFGKTVRGSNAAGTEDKKISEGDAAAPGEDGAAEADADYGQAAEAEPEHANPEEEHENPAFLAKKVAKHPNPAFLAGSTEKRKEEVAPRMFGKLVDESRPREVFVAERGEAFGSRSAQFPPLGTREESFMLDKNGLWVGMQTLEVGGFGATRTDWQWNLLCNSDLELDGVSTAPKPLLHVRVRLDGKRFAFSAPSVKELEEWIVAFHALGFIKEGSFANPKFLRNLGLL
jgi:hypothetical protein